MRSCIQFLVEMKAKYNPIISNIVRMRIKKRKQFMKILLKIYDKDNIKNFKNYVDKKIKKIIF